ncbi:MAG TPA: branched-chain amino acid ABC transporter permease [Burkholderiaceae bacterium]|nr:branched-chain amino acid ABC transporter permease [Burkholderiaceae bacterium]
MASLTFILLYGVSYGLILCLISLGLVLTMGLMRVVNLAHGAMAAIGGYLAPSTRNPPRGPLTGAPFAAALIVAVAAVALLGVIAERVLFRFLYGRSELDQVLVTIGLNFVVIAGLTAAFGANLYPLELPAALKGNVDLGIREFEIYRVFTTVVCLGVIAALWWSFEHTRIGAKVRAAVDNRTMTQAIGIDVPRLYRGMFALGSGLAALGGALGAPILPMQPMWPFKYLVLMLVIVSLSGSGRIRAAVLVSLLVGIVEVGGRYLFPQFGGFYIYLLLIVLMIWRPHGLLAPRVST